MPNELTWFAGSESSQVIRQDGRWFARRMSDGAMTELYGSLEELSRDLADGNAVFQDPLDRVLDAFDRRAEEMFGSRRDDNNDNSTQGRC